VVENYQGCTKDKYGLVVAAERRAAGDPELAQIVDGLQSYFKKDRRQYAQFVDGGITDNLGPRAIYEIFFMFALRHW
jgi:NTE family protein